MGNTYNSNTVYHSVQKCSYVKFINVPSMLDIGGTLSDPTDESLVMSMIDYATLNAISGFTKKNSFEHLTAKQEDENIGFGRDGGIEDDDDTMDQELDDN